ncbi:MAG: NACHT domain-containing protein, partial [Egibacteraceae bacterium]
HGLARPQVTPQLLAATADRLAVEVAEQETTLQARLLGTDAPGVSAANVEFERSLVRFRDAGGQTAGTLDTVRDYYQQLRPARMVILGVPGSGKTVLLVELLVQLLEQRRRIPSEERAEVAVPLRFNLAGWNTDTPFEDWLAADITQRFRGVNLEIARRLVAERRVLALLDGLDEMDAEDASLRRADAAVKQLNAYLSLHGRELAPLVVACRQEHYDRLQAPLDCATAVRVQDLSTDLIVGYLRDQFRGSDEAAVWRPVLENLERDRDGMLAGQLRTPWRLTLATTIYRGRDRGAGPCELLPEDQQPGRNPGQPEDAARYTQRIEALLLDGFVPAAARLHPSDRYPDSDQVVGWLRTVAGHLRWQADHGRSGTDIVLHEWWPAAGQRQVRFWAVAVNVAAVLPLLCVLFWPAMGPPWRWVGYVREHAAVFADLPRDILVGDVLLLLALIFMVGGAVWAGLRQEVEPPSNVRLVMPRTPDEWRKLARGLAVGLAVGFAFVLAVGFAFVLAVGLAVGFAFGFAFVLAFVLAGGLTLGLVAGLAVGLAVGLDRGLDGAVTPREPLHNAFMSMLVGGLVGGLAVGLAFGLVFGLVFGLLGSQVLVRYGVAVLLAARARSLPLRLGLFLEWARAAGVIRVSGIAYQFRHRELQMWLTPTMDADAASGSSAL